MRRRSAKRKRQKLSPVERQRKQAERRLRTNIRTVFTNAGFEHIPTREANIVVAGLTGDLDALFLIDNVCVVVEDTILSGAGIGDHLRKKAEYYNHLAQNQGELFQALRTLLPRFEDHLSRNVQYAVSEYAM